MKQVGNKWCAYSNKDKYLKNCGLDLNYLLVDIHASQLKFFHCQYRPLHIIIFQKFEKGNHVNNLSFLGKAVGR